MLITRSRRAATRSRRVVLTVAVALLCAVGLGVTAQSAMAASTFNWSSGLTRYVQPGQLALASPSGVYQMRFQHDGNLVVYRYGTPVWHSNTYNRGVRRMIFSRDGSMILENSVQGGWAWRVGGGAPFGKYQLAMQNDGNLVFYVFSSQYGTYASWNTGIPR